MKLNWFKITGVVLFVTVITFVGVLLTVAGLGFDHQVMQHWITTTDTNTQYSQHLAGTYHHGKIGITALSSFFGFIWIGVTLASGKFFNWIYRGCPDF